jgi:O-methyltransferase
MNFSNEPATGSSSSISRKSNQNRIQPWNEDEEFLKLHGIIKGVSVVDSVRCYILFQFLKQVRNVPGHLAEIGVYRGGTAFLMAACRSPERQLHLFDTFEGMPECDPIIDRHTLGDFSNTSVERVQNLLGDAGDLFFHPGLFPETAAAVESQMFSFVHIDCDIYRSVLEACQFFHPRLEKGGILLFDDYGFVTCPGAKMAVDEFFSSKSESPIYLPTGQCFVIKQ